MKSWMNHDISFIQIIIGIKIECGAKNFHSILIKSIRNLIVMLQKENNIKDLLGSEWR